MRGDQHVADGQHGACAFAPYGGHFGPAIHACWQHGLATLDIALRGQADEHALDIMRMDRLARQGKARCQLGKPQLDLRIGRRTVGIVPQAHIPGPFPAFCIAALDRQRRTMRHVQRQHRAAAPAKTQHAMCVIGPRFIRQQRVVERIFALPDKSGQLALVVEAALHPQRVGRGGDDTRHHRSREIDRPEPRIEPLDMIGMLPAAFAGKPETHCETPVKCVPSSRAWSGAVRLVWGRGSVAEG